MTTTQTNRRRGPQHPRWKGGRTLDSDGYVLLTDSNSEGRGGRLLEHVAVVERALGKPLRRTAPIHHVDGNRQNNANMNLVACDSQAYHMLLEQRQRAFDACGDANALRCVRCHGYDRQDEISSHRTRTDGLFSEHRSCRNEYQRRRNESKRLTPRPPKRVQFRGVMRDDRLSLRPWQAHIRANGRDYVSPCFATGQEAAEWYDQMATKLHGTRAVTNRSLGLIA